jgi:CheY-like chemotaxis protein
VLWPISQRLPFAIGSDSTGYAVFSSVLKRNRIASGGLKVGRLVMIVDDHAITRSMLRAVFETEDLRGSDAADGAEGVQKAQAEKPSLIILDLSMPVMNGLEAARELKVLMPHLPLLMFTNNVGEILKKDAFSAGIFAVICKSDSDSSQQLVAHAKALLGLDGAAFRERFVTD